MKNEDWTKQRDARGSVFECLFRGARRTNLYAIETIRASGIAIRQVHTQLFPYLSVQGERVSDIAKKMGISKQAVAKSVDELEAMGAVEKIPDPLDGRAKLVRLNPGAFLLGLDALQEIERAFEEEIGAQRMEAFLETLLDLNTFLDNQDPKI